MLRRICCFHEVEMAWLYARRSSATVGGPICWQPTFARTGDSKTVIAKNLLLPPPEPEWPERRLAGSAGVWGARGEKTPNPADGGRREVPSGGFLGVNYG